MHYDFTIECCDAENAYTHTWIAYLLFHNIHFHQCHLVAQVVILAEVACRVEVAPVPMEVHWFLCASSVPADSLLCHIRIKGSRPYYFY